MNDENLIALQTICSSIQSLLGPSKSLKCCLSSDPNEDGLINDPLQLVEVLVGGVSDSHPVVQLVLEACQDQRKTCGCGITTLVSMSTYWARGVARLIQEVSAWESQYAAQLHIDWVKVTWSEGTFYDEESREPIQFEFAIGRSLLSEDIQRFSPVPTPDSTYCPISNCFAVDLTLLGTSVISGHDYIVTVRAVDNAGIMSYTTRGIPAPVVFYIFEETLSLCEKTILNLKLPLNTLQHQTTAVALTRERMILQVSGEQECESISTTAPHGGAQTLLASAPRQQTQTAASTTFSPGGAQSSKASTPKKKNRIVASLLSGQLTSKSASTNARTSLASAPRRNRVMVYSRHFSSSARSSDQLSQEKKETTSQAVTSLNGVSSEESRHTWIAVIGDRLSSGRPVAMQLAREVVETQLAAANQIQMKYIFHHSTLGRDKECSRVVHGLVMDLRPGMITVVSKHRRNPLRVVVIDGDCTPSHTHLGLQKRTHVTSHDLRQLYECSSEVNWLKKCSEMLRNLKVGVVVVSGAVSPLLWEHSIANGIVILRGVAKQQLEGVCHITGATPLSYFTDCLQRQVGRHTVELTAEEWGWAKPSFLLKGQRDRAFERRYICTMKSFGPSASVGMVATVLLSGKTEWLVKLLEHEVLNCLCRLKLAFEDGFLLPGGGITEAVCVSKLRLKLSQLNSELSRTDLSLSNQRTDVNTSFAMATSWMSDCSLVACWRPHVYEVFVDGLMQYIARVLINCSCSGETYVAMATAEELVKKVVGGGDKGVWSMRESKALDVAKSKMAAWRRALDLLRLVFLSTRIQIHKEAALRW